MNDKNSDQSSHELDQSERILWVISTIGLIYAIACVVFKI